MRKSQMNSLVAGVKVQSKKDSTVYEIAGLDKEQQKVILTDGKVYSFSTLYRWFDLYVEPLVDEQDNTEQQDTTADTEQQEDTDTTATTATDTQDDQLHDDIDKTTKKHAISRDIATTNTLNGIVDLHRCKLEQMKEYIKVSREGVKRTLVYIRTPRGTGYHFDVSKKTWNKLTSEYQQYLIEQYGASIVDSSRGLWRIANCNELDVFEVLLLTALKIA